jgi:hypothetical protein
VARIVWSRTAGGIATTSATNGTAAVAIAVRPEGLGGVAACGMDRLMPSPVRVWLILL